MTSARPSSFGIVLIVLIVLIVIVSFWKPERDRSAFLESNTYGAWRTCEELRGEAREKRLMSDPRHRADSTKGTDGAKERFQLDRLSRSAVRGAACVVSLKPLKPRRLWPSGVLGEELCCLPGAGIRT